jgi:primary-amine oxidase
MDSETPELHHDANRWGGGRFIASRVPWTFLARARLAGCVPVAPGGLPVWAAGDRPVVDRDLAVGYVFAHTHVPHTKDWPVMPAAALGFWLRPDGFFERNPALDVPAPKP